MACHSTVISGWASTPTVIWGCIAFVVWWVFSVFPAVPFLPIGRTAGSVLGAILMVVFQVLSPDCAFAAVDLPILGLLWGTMVISVYLKRAGLFEYLEKAMMWKTRGGMDILCRLCLLSALSSALFTNDTTCVVLTGFVLKLCREKRLHPKPFLLALACSSNIGSAATPIGNPQNLVIAVSSGISFGRFLSGVLPAVAVGLVVNTLLLMAVYGRSLSLAPDDSTLSLETARRGEIPRKKTGHVNVGSPDRHGESTQRILSHRLPPAVISTLLLTAVVNTRLLLMPVVNTLLWMAVYGLSLSLAPADSTPSQKTALCGKKTALRGKKTALRGKNEAVHGHAELRWNPLAHTGDAGDKIIERQNSLKSGALSERSESTIIHIPSLSSRAERRRGSSPTAVSCDVLEARPDAGSEFKKRHRSELGEAQIRDLNAASVHKKRSLSELRAAVKTFWRQKLWKPSVYLVTIGMLAALLAGLSLPWTAITAAVGMTLLDFSDAGPSLEQVTYTLLVFFSGMFIATSGFNATGAPEEFWLAVEPHSRIDSASGVSVLSLVVTVLSNVVSNVPTVILLGSRVAQSAANIPGASSDKAWLILAWVSTVAGNLTLVGSAANLIVSEQARPTLADKVQSYFQEPGRATYNLTFWNHIKFGFPSTLIVTAVGLLPLVIRKF